MRVFLRILVGLGVLVVLSIAAVIALGYFYGPSLVEKRKEAETFAAHARHADCADELARRASSCAGTSASCVLETSLFMSACMAKAQGDVAEFCASVPALTDRAAHATWSADFCRARELAQEKCDYVTAMIAGMCAQERDARARRRGILLSDPG